MFAFYLSALEILFSLPSFSSSARVDMAVAARSSKLT